MIRLEHKVEYQRYGFSALPAKNQGVPQQTEAGSASENGSVYCQFRELPWFARRWEYVSVADLYLA
jgi:hypothetical protein